MVTIRDCISVMFGLIILTQCNTKQNSNSTTETSSSPIKAQSEKPLIGGWEYNNTIWYTSRLTLEDNGTFTFHDQGCYGQRFSQGQWTNNYGTILLISFDTFKQKEQDKSYQSDKNEDLNDVKQRRKEGKGEYSFGGLKEVPPPMLPVPDDTVLFYIDKVQLEFKKDTLYCVGSNKLLKNAKFHRTKNNR